MKLLLKHWVKSVRLRPLQPIILSVVLLISILSMVLSLSVHDLLQQESELWQAEGYGSADISISLNGTCKSRFMFESDVSALLGDKAKVAGTYELPLSYGEDKQTVFGVAVDLYQIENIFSFEFLEYGKISASTVDISAFISREFADANGISLGDKIVFSVFGEDKSYTVVGIAKNRFLASYDVMVDVEGIVRILANDSALIASLGDRFKPSSTVYIDVEAGCSIDECIEILKQNENFADKTISDVSHIVATEMNTEILEIPIIVVTVLMALLSAVIVFSCLFVISSERTEESLIFSIAGAKPRLLDLMQHLEIAGYWAIASILAVIFIKPLTNFLIGYMDFEYATATVYADNLIVGIAAILLVSMISVIVFVFSRRVKSKSKSERKISNTIALAVLVIFALTLALQIIVPANFKFTLYVPALIFISLAIMVGMPIVMKRYLKRADKKQDAKFEKSLVLKNRALRYAIKNVFKVNAIHNSARLIALMVAIMLTFLVVLMSAYGNIYMMDHIFSTDYAVINATERCEAKIEECESVRDSYRVYMDSSTHDGNIVTYVLASDSINAFADDMELSFMTEGNGAIISTGQAKLLGLEIGDSFSIRVAGKDLDLRVADIVKSGIAAIIIDAEHFGIPYNMIMVDKAEGISNDELVSELSEKTASELAIISSVEQLTEEKLRPIYVYVDAANLLMIITVIFVLIGLCDNLYDSYRSRRGEMELYYLAGMSKREIRLMKLAEISITLVIGALVGLICAILLIYSTNIGMYTFGYETLISAFKLI